MGLLYLPDELILKILGYLSISTLHHRVALVCKKMCRLTRDQELHQSLIFNSKHSNASDVVKYISGFGSSLKVLRLTNYSRFKMIFNAVDRCARGLKILDLSNDYNVKARQTLMAFKILTSRAVLPNLEELHVRVSVARFNPTTSMDRYRMRDTMRDLFKNRGQIIKRLDWIAPYRSGGSGLEFIDHCTALDSLKIYCPLDSQFLYRQILYMSSLTELWIWIQPSQTTPEFIQLFEDAKWTNLKKLYLKLGDIGAWSEETLISNIFNAAPELEALKLTRPLYDMQQTSIPANFDAHQNVMLKYLWLVIEEFGVEELVRFRMRSPNLRFLSLDSSRRGNSPEINNDLKEAVESCLTPLVVLYNGTCFESPSANGKNIASEAEKFFSSESEFLSNLG